MKNTQSSEEIKANSDSSVLEALNRVLATIEFNLDGTIITANDNFLSTFDYSLDEIEGKHHRIFCDPEFTKSVCYKDFWENLARGEHDSGKYKRITKTGNEIWISAFYNPILGADGKPYKVVKFASDITAEKLKNSD